MKEKEERLLRLWKIRQEQEGVDVSGVKTLEEAKHFYDKKSTKKGTSKKSTKKVEFAVTEEDSNVHVKPVIDGEIIDTPVEEVEIPEITEEEVQAVANAIVEEASENDKTIEEIVTEIVEESHETEPVVAGE